MKLFAVRSKKTGYYFRFEEYCDDGWGKYEDIITVKKDGQLYPDDLPTFFHDNILNRSHYDFKNHTNDELELVEFTLTEK